jgi:hypothetical protein
VAAEYFWLVSFPFRYPYRKRMRGSEAAQKNDITKISLSYRGRVQCPVNATTKSLQ